MANSGVHRKRGTWNAWITFFHCPWFPKSAIGYVPVAPGAGRREERELDAFDLSFGSVGGDGPNGYVLHLPPEQMTASWKRNFAKISSSRAFLPLTVQEP